MKRICSLFLALAMLLAFLPAAPAHAAEITPVSTQNVGQQNYWRWSRPVSSYLTPTESGYQRAEYITDPNGEPCLLLEDYLEGSMQCVSSRTIPLELPVFGGVFYGQTYNFLICGQENLEEDDAREVIRVIRFDKSWNRIDHLSISGINTIRPFEAGSLRCAEFGSRLFIRTCHQMYTDPDDGHNHQANLQLLINTGSMTLLDSVHGVFNESVGYVSHSFNQFCIADGSDFITADHGDAYPRSMILSRYSGADTMDSFRNGSGSWPRDVESANLLTFSGRIGDNTTGASLGGLAVSDSSFLAVGNTTKQADGANLNGARNIFVAACPRDSLNSGYVVVNALTGYPADSEIEASTPQLVKIAADRFLILWTAEPGQLFYIFLNGFGNPASDLYSDQGFLSDCAPILHNGKVTWYYTDNSQPIFLSIDPEHPEKVERNFYHTHEWTEWTTDPENPGQQIRTCTLCGITETRPMPASFVDVKESDYFYKPVMWAVENGITSGKSDDRFSPGEVCTRAQIMTFLWAAMNRPEPESASSGFADVPAGSYYEKAVRWAVENGITDGVDSEHFGPGRKCTRAQIVTFLWIAAGRPEPTDASGGFADVPAGSYYEKAVRWAVENGVTDGVSDGLFGSKDACTRAQAVTFLYQVFAK